MGWRAGGLLVAAGLPRRCLRPDAPAPLHPPPCPLLWRSGHCKQLAPKWRRVAEALHGVAKVAAVNCEQQQALCQQYGIRSYPTIRAFR